MSCAGTESEVQIAMWMVPPDRKWTGNDEKWMEMTRRCGRRHLIAVGLLEMRGKNEKREGKKCCEGNL